MCRSASANTRDARGSDSSAIEEIFDEAQRYYQADCLAEAERLFRQVLTLDPRHAISWHRLGVICYRTGRYEKSIEMIGNAIAIDARVAAFHSSLGNALGAQGKLNDAVVSYQRALALKPDFAGAHSNLGNVFQAQGRFDDAIAHCQQALALKPDFPEAHNNLGNAFQAQGRFDEAIAHYERALALKPDYPEAHNNLGNALQALGQFDDAVACYEKALALKPDYPEAHSNLGNALQALGQFDDAVACYEKALTFKPDFAEACNSLGTVLWFQGRLADALARYKRAFVLKPGFAEAHHNYANLKRFHAGDADLKTLERLAADLDRMPANKAVYIHFALAKALEDVGDYDRTFQHLLKGNTLKRQEIRYDEAATEALFKRLPEIFDEHLFERFRGRGNPSQVPIFIVGMPRSGSTLIEQILASHPQVLGGGELSDLRTVANGISGHGSQLLRYPDYIPTLDEAMIRRLGRAYLSRLPTLRDEQVRITDKLLFNFTRIGLIHLMFPDARIVHVMRDPADTCASCFATLFVAEGLYFSYDLTELGRYYRRYMAVMAHWRSVLPPGTIFDVSYEEVVDNLEQQAGRLIAYCGLPWVDRCLNFHETPRPVATASAAQVRRPLFRSSIKRWKRFETHLQPLLRELSDLGPTGKANGPG